MLEEEKVKKAAKRKDELMQIMANAMQLKPANECVPMKKESTHEVSEESMLPYLTPPQNRHKW